MPIQKQNTTWHQAGTCCTGLVVVLFCLLTTPGASAQSADDENPFAEIEEKQKTAIPEPIEVYKGRRIAQTMHFKGAEWLIRDEREREERCSLMLANLGVEPGMTVCDMGCGNGFYSIPMARMAGEHGRVLAVDVQPEMLAMLRDRAEDEGVANITPILGSYHDPKLPENSVDLVLMVDVYHEFSHPEPMLSAIRKALKPDGLIALVEYRMEDKSVPIKLLHKMSKKQIMKEYVPNGFKLVREFEKLPWQHMMFFGVDENFDEEFVQPDAPDNVKQTGPEQSNDEQATACCAD